MRRLKVIFFSLIDYLKLPDGIKFDLTNPKIKEMFTEIATVNRNLENIGSTNSRNMVR